MVCWQPRTHYARRVSDVGVQTDDLGWLARVASIQADARDTEDMMRRLLEAIADVTGLESAYVTRFDWEDDRLSLVSRHTSAPERALPEDLDIPIADSLCIRTLRDGEFWVDDVHDQWSEVAHLYDDIRTWVSVPVRLDDDDAPFGMLCAASPETSDGNDTIRPVLELLSSLIGTKLAADRRRDHAEQRAEAAETMLRRRMEFAAMTEHAMKGPLTVIDGWTSTLLEQAESLDPASREQALDAIRRATDRLGMQLEDLVTEARSTLVKGTSEAQRLDEVVRRVVDDFGMPTFSFVGGPTEALVDRRGVEVVVEHLLENVISHTDEGTPVDVDTRTEGDEAVLEVSDRGPGLPDGMDVFAPFASGRGGSGLGLWIVRSVVETMGGTVDAGPAYPRGTTFTCRFPTP